MRLQASRLPRAVRAVALGAFLATAAAGITACGEEEETVTDEIEDAADEVEDSIDDLND